MRTSHATTVWENNKLHFKAFGGPTVVKRYIEDGVYKWEYPNLGHDQNEAHLQGARACTFI